MRRELLNKVRSFFQHRVKVLMYHRVAELKSDVWDIAVSPHNFEEQLKVLQKSGKVISANELIVKLAAGKIEKDGIVITFDDGYADNFHTAKPLLEKYKLPSTFFIASANIGSNDEFWWDELEDVFLFSTQLPQNFLMTINGREIRFKLEDEEILNEELLNKHKSWKACDEPPPTTRSSLFFKVWQEIRPLATGPQKDQMKLIREWAGVPTSSRGEYKSMSKEWLKELSRNRLFTIGAHTVNHSALAFHPKEYQRNELLNNKGFLKEITGDEASLFSYPYGNYNKETTEAARELNLQAAFTTEEETVKIQSEKYRLGRFQVKNWGAAEFKEKLSLWSKV